MLIDVLPLRAVARARAAVTAARRQLQGDLCWGLIDGAARWRSLTIQVRQVCTRRKDATRSREQNTNPENNAQSLGRSCRPSGRICSLTPWRASSREASACSRGFGSGLGLGLGLGSEG
eukprot:scaffold111568_cov57-Phaeocystis_antarctica.AAC.4